MAGKVKGKQIEDATVSNANLADMAQDRIKGRITTGSGAPEDLTPQQARDVMSVYSKDEVDALVWCVAVIGC